MVRAGGACRRRGFGRYEIILDSATDPDGSIGGTKGSKILELMPDKK